MREEGRQHSGASKTLNLQLKLLLPFYWLLYHGTCDGS